MENFIIIILVIILIETSYLVTRNNLKGTKINSKNNQPVFVDTSVLIDGRILPVAESGFIGRKLLIPRSVIGELQLLADQADNAKRVKARSGLDIVSKLQEIPNLDVEIFPDERKASEGVDTRLLRLAKKHHGAICTIDFNLNKVARTEKIDVLNLNNLVMNLRMAYLPGETTTLQLVQKGQEAKQGVGYLTDGTMVVVENARNKVGQEVKVCFTRSLQTEAGKMMFAELVTDKPKNPKKQDTPKQSNHGHQNYNRNKKPSKPKTQEDKIVNMMNQ